MKIQSLALLLAALSIGALSSSNMSLATSYEEEDKCYEACYDQHIQSLENCIIMRSWCETSCEAQSPTGCGESCVDTCFETEDRCDLLANEQYEQCTDSCVAEDENDDDDRYDYANFGY